MRNIFMDGVGNRAHPDLIAAVAYADGWNTAFAGLLHDVIDSSPPFTVILTEHIVIRATRRHSCTLDRDYRGRA